MKINASIASRISMLRTLLILTVVFIHCRKVASPTDIDVYDIWAVIYSLLQDRMGRFAVPTLTMISAYLLFNAGLDLSPIKLYKKKLTTLIVPFFFFNVVYFCLQYATEYVTGWAPLYHLTNAGRYFTVNRIISYSGAPANGALHFLRDLFVLVLLAPIFGRFLRHAPLIGFVFVCIVFLNNLDGHLVNRNSMAVTFYIGGWAAVRKWNVEKLDAYAIPAFVALVSICTVLVLRQVNDLLPIYLVSPILVWIASSRLAGSRLGTWAATNSRYSFFVFLVHMPLLAALDRITGGSNFGLTPFTYAVVATPLVVIEAVVLYNVALRFMPNVFNFMIGARARPAPKAVAVPAFVERRKAPRTADAPVYTEAFRKTILQALGDARLAAVKSHDLGHATSVH